MGWGGGVGWGSVEKLQPQVANTGSKFRFIKKKKQIRKEKRRFILDISLSKQK